MFDTVAGIGYYGDTAGLDGNGHRNHDWVDNDPNNWIGSAATQADKLDFSLIDADLTTTAIDPFQHSYNIAGNIGYLGDGTTGAPRTWDDMFADYAGPGYICWFTYWSSASGGAGHKPVTYIVGNNGTTAAPNYFSIEFSNIAELTAANFIGVLQ